MEERMLFKNWYVMKGFGRALAYDMAKQPGFPVERNKRKGSKMRVKVEAADEWLLTRGENQK
jgi:hypothetical protein